MKCQKCGNEMRIMRSFTEVLGDNSDSTQTEVFTVQKLACRTKSCENYGTETAENRVKIYPM